ncbi:MAG: hypothetical protein JJ900_09700 [Rhodospirillales bacterium]|nr:hypothetical protein [Rhodospirillales bacterium]MBO6787113.1 hypothetical protein [Rhodospirillales bacterium]
MAIALASCKEATPQVPAGTVTNPVPTVDPDFKVPSLILGSNHHIGSSDASKATLSGLKFLVAKGALPKGRKMRLAVRLLDVNDLPWIVAGAPPTTDVIPGSPVYESDIEVTKASDATSLANLRSGRRLELQLRVFRKDDPTQYFPVEIPGNVIYYNGKDDAKVTWASPTDGKVAEIATSGTKLTMKFPPNADIAFPGLRRTLNFTAAFADVSGQPKFTDGTITLEAPHDNAFDPASGTHSVNLKFKTGEVDYRALRQPDSGAAKANTLTVNFGIKDTKGDLPELPTLQIKPSGS